MDWTYSTPVSDNVIVLCEDFIINADEVLSIEFSDKIEILFKNGITKTITPKSKTYLQAYKRSIRTYYNTLMNEAE